VNTYRHIYRRLRWLPIALFVLICAPRAFAELRPEIGTRALGLGGAFISNADDPTGMLWNPAGLARLRAGNLVYDLSQGAFSVAYPLDAIGTVGFSLLDLNGADRFFINEPENPIGTFELGNNQALLSYARAIGEWQVGGNFSYSRAPYSGSRWKPSYDLGMITRLNPELAVGATWRDISDVVITGRNGNILQSFDQQFALGATWTPLRYLQLSGALDTPSWLLRSGVETGVYGVSLRLGSIIELRQAEEAFSWSVGLSLNRWNKQLHYAYLRQPGREHKHFVSVGLTFGGVQQTDMPPIAEPPPQNPEVTEATPTAVEPTPIPVEPIPTQDDTELLYQLAAQHSIEVELILAMIQVESDFQPDTVSKSGAVGLTQLMPGTARDLGLKVPNYPNPRKPRPDPKIDERFHPRKNLKAGVKYLNAMLARYDGNYVLAIAAYNAGPGNVQENVPLIRETERHVGKVLNQYYQYKLEPEEVDADAGKLDELLAGDVNGQP
jgi:hypothetical protein